MNKLLILLFLFSTQYVFSKNYGPDDYIKMKGKRYELLDRLHYNPKTDTMRSLNTDVLNVLKTFRKEINEAALLYPDVNPATLTSCILAENTMNVQWDDDVQTWLAEYAPDRGFSLITSLFGKKSNNVSIGIGQINVRAALEVDGHLAKVEKRETYTYHNENKVKAILTKPKGAFIYAATIVQYAIDAYKERGFDIKEKPEIICSLYNLGKIKKRALNSKTKEKEPSVNYFGFFVDYHFAKVQSEFPKLKREKFNKVTIRQNKNTSPIPPNTKNQINNSIEKSDKVTIETSKTPWIQRTYNLSMNTKSLLAPPTCGTKDSEIPKKTIQGKLKVVAFKLDCKMNSWTAVQLQDGTLSWIKSIDLQNNLTYAMTPMEKKTRSAQCLPKDELSVCSEQLKNNNIKQGPPYLLKIKGLIKYFVPVYRRKIKDPSLLLKQIERTKTKFIRKLNRKLKRKSRRKRITEWKDERNPHRNLFLIEAHLEKCNKTPGEVCFLANKSAHSILSIMENNQLFSNNSTGKSNLKMFKALKVETFSSYTSKEKTNILQSLIDPKHIKLIIKAAKRKRDAIFEELKKNSKNTKENKADLIKYKIMFDWISTLESCKDCKIESPYTGGELLSILNKKGLMSKNRFFQIIRNNLSKIKIVNPKELKLYSPLAVAIEELKQDCVPALTKAGKSSSIFKYSFENALQYSDLKLSKTKKSKTKSQIMTNIQKLKNECQIQKACSENIGINNNQSNCMNIKSSNEIDNFCEFSNYGAKARFLKAFSIFSCQFRSHNGIGSSCNNILKAIEKIEKLEAIADISCVKQIIIPTPEHFHRINEKTSSTILQNKLGFLENKKDKNISIILKSECR